MKRIIHSGVIIKTLMDDYSDALNRAARNILNNTGKGDDNEIIK